MKQMNLAAPLKRNLLKKSNINNGELIEVIKKTISNAVLRQTFISFRRNYIRNSPNSRGVFRTLPNIYNGEFLRNYNHGQNIWHEIDKPNKTGQKKKSLISTFACFLTAIAKV